MLILCSAFGSGCADPAESPETSSGDPAGRDSAQAAGADLVIDSGNSPYVVNDLQEWGAVHINKDGILSINANGQMRATGIAMESNSVLRIAGGLLIITGTNDSPGAFMEGAGSELDIRGGAAIKLVPYPGMSSMLTSNGGKGSLNLTLSSVIVINGSSIDVIGAQGYDLPPSVTGKSSAWTSGPLSCDCSRGGISELALSAGSAGATFILDNATLTSEGGRGGKAADGGNATSGINAGSSGGFSDCGPVSGYVGAGGSSTISLRSNGRIVISGSKITARGGNGGQAGRGGDGYASGGGGGGFAGGDPGDYPNGESSRVEGHVSVGGTSGVAICADALEVAGSEIAASGGNGGEGGDGGNAVGSGSGGGGGYGGGGGFQSTGMSTNVTGYVGSGGDSALQVEARYLSMNSSNITASGGSGGDGGNGGGAGSNAGGGGGGYGGGGGGDGWYPQGGGSTKVGGRVGAGGNSSLYVSADERLFLDRDRLEANGGRGGNGGKGSPSSGGGGGGYGGGGGGTGGVGGGTTEVGGNVGDGGSSSLAIGAGDAYILSTNTIEARKGPGGDGSASPGGGQGRGGEGKGRTTAGGTATEVLPPSGVILVSPRNGETNASNTPTLEWRAVLGKAPLLGNLSSYQVQLSYDGGFDSPVLDRIAPGDYLDCPLLKFQTHYWRVRANYTSGTGDWSEIWNFSFTNRAPEAMNPVTYLEIPEDGFDDHSVRLSDMFRDPDGDSLTYASRGSANITVQIGSDSAVNFTPSPDWNGHENITFTANDGVLNPNECPGFSVHVFVVPVNDPPVLSAPFDTLVMDEDTKDSSMNLLAHFDDPADHDRLSFDSIGFPQMDVRIWENGSVELEPALHWYGEGNITFIATDSSLEAEGELKVVVRHVNVLPEFSGLETNYTVFEDSWLNVSFDVSDVETPDGIAVSCDLSDVPGAVAGQNFFFDAARRSLSLLADNQMVGQRSVTLTAVDADGGRTDFPLAVSIINVNDAPVLERIPDQEIWEDALWEFDVIAHDDDIIHGDRLVFAEDSALFEMDGETGHIAFVPGNEQVGSYDVTVTATDLAGASCATSIRLIVRNVNDPPADVAILSPADGSVFKWNQIVRMRGSALDIDRGDILDFAWECDGVVIGHGESLNRSFSSGKHVLRLKVSDGNATVTSEAAFKVEQKPPEGFWSGPYVSAIIIIIVSAVAVIYLITWRKFKRK